MAPTSRSEATRVSSSHRLHFDATNNVIEYEAFINRLQIVGEVGAWQLLVRGDSKLVVNQVMKEIKPCDPKMCGYYDEVRKLKEKFRGFKLQHSYRHFNIEVDDLSTIDQGENPSQVESSHSTSTNPY
jgi:ribonuclease HI